MLVQNFVGSHVAVERLGGETFVNRTVSVIQLSAQRINGSYSAPDAKTWCTWFRMSNYKFFWRHVFDGRWSVLSVQNICCS